MSAIATSFNRSSFGRWINSPAGRVFRTVAGVAFIAAGLVRRGRPGSLALLAWGILPLSAGTLDVCYVSASLAGPLRGQKCRDEAL
ncbi:hypothetical protein [Tessaracoccus lapidicaptus]|uniref:hypothetical protein n=1 Tax=Tessaracoccus lapidicaptus TaxID=1427523 RepID=UPI0033421C0E